MYIELRDINKSFGDFQASRSVSFGIARGTLAALLGPSGSGKTTILRMIAGLETPDSGDIFINARRVNDLAPSVRGIGFVFQNYALFRYMTVFDNIAFGLRVKKEKAAAIRARVEELLELIGLEDFGKRHPAQLSGGQKQRVAFARALAPNPGLLLLDEPFAAIDAKVRRELRVWLRDMIRRLGITSIFVTHDQDEAIEVADEIIVTNKGRVEQLGAPPDLYREPATPFVADFIGESAPVENIAAFRGFEANVQGTPGAVRPEFLKVFAVGDVIQYPNSVEDAVVDDVAFRGAWLELGLVLRGIRLTARYSLEKQPPRIGDFVKVLVYRLYAFEDGKVSLRRNAELNASRHGYSYSI
ncbi:MAG: ABC transporter ATP-binding protein [Desulfovibrio sp.]|jgi:sulfate transport system ATP-binding protein|nr:ABC transporter ATP-binding protein [Desulfovibrio sp.]